MRLHFEDYEEVFTPGAPVFLENFFVGREQEAKDLHRILHRRGFHPIIIGDRGVGKTSLFRQALKNSESNIVSIECGYRMNFEELAIRILDELGYDTDETESTRDISKEVNGQAKVMGIGVGAKGTQKDSTKRKGLAMKDLNSWDLFSVLRSLPEKNIIVIDEYDRILPEKENVHAAMADLIKNLADYSAETETRFVIIGVGQRVADLLGKHESIERSTCEIYLRPLRDEDVFFFLTEAEEQLQFQFDKDVKQSIINCAMGYPYFFHLVGLECLDAMQDRDPNSRSVTKEDYERAIEKAVRRAFQAELRKYRKAINGLDERDSLMIRELSLRVGGQRLKRLKFRQEMVTSRIFASDEFDAILLKLQQEANLVYISRRYDVIRFRDPLLAPFLRSWIHGHQISSKPQATQLGLFSWKDFQEDPVADG